MAENRGRTVQPPSNIGFLVRYWLSLSGYAVPPEPTPLLEQEILRLPGITPSLTTTLRLLAISLNDRHSLQCPLTQSTFVQTS